jgi:hypothetical protein
MFLSKKPDSARGEAQRHRRLMTTIDRIVGDIVLHDASARMEERVAALTPEFVGAYVFGRLGDRLTVQEATEYLAAVLAVRGFPIAHLLPSGDAVTS